MAIDWEQTFRTWSKPSSDHESEKQENAERMVGDAIRMYQQLKDRNIKIIAQGSYRNNTNVRQESDVDICVCCMDPFFPDYTFADYTAAEIGNVNATYTYAQFKNEVQAALEAKFGKLGVRRGDKAFDVHENTYRVDADVVPAFALRMYLKQQFNYSSGGYLRPYVQPEGIKFICDSGLTSTNWPEQHYSNGVEKNKSTGGRFKLIVRAVKRLQFYLLEKKVITESIPSYLIECLMYNVPDSLFLGDSYSKNVKDGLLNCYSATKDDAAASAKWTEVNGIKFLFHVSQPWTRQQANNFALAAWYYVEKN